MKNKRQILLHAFAINLLHAHILLVAVQQLVLRAQIIPLHHLSVGDAVHFYSNMYVET